MNIDELFSQLTKLNINITAKEICEIWGMDVSSFSRKKKLQTEIKHRNIQQLEEALNIKLVKQYLNSDNYNEYCVPMTYRPTVYLSAGYGVEIYDENKEILMVDSRLLLSERGLKINPDHCEIVRVSGNSMSPEYRHNDRVIIDRADTELLDGHIFAFRYNGQCYVKEVNLLGNKIKCISLNKEYDPFYINAGEEFTVLGRIIPRIRL